MRVVVLRLVPHPDTPARVVEAIEARVERASSHLKLVYALSGDLDRLRLAPPGPSAFADGLWRTTCFEAFVAGGEGYDEFNFSPSGAYAAYRFSGYRAGMTRLDAAPAIAWNRGRLEASVPLRPDARRLALSAVIEEGEEPSLSVSYWALHHAPGKPDFHHPHAFVVDIDELRH